MNNTTLKLINFRLDRIAKVLILNSSFIGDIGLLRGKMGIAIFFYQYAQYIGDEEYHHYADELIDEIYEEICVSTPKNFEDGLFGIGWGIEYLVSNNFLEADTDQALYEIDYAAFVSTIRQPVSIVNKTSLFGLGFYYLIRLGIQNSDDNLDILKKKGSLIYLMDECERLLTKNILFNVTIPILTPYQLNSLIWFIVQTRKLGLFPIKNDKLVNALYHYINEKLEDKYDLVDKTIGLLLIENLNIIDHSEIKKKSQIMEKVAATSINIPLNQDSYIDLYIKSGWCNLLYNQINPIFSEDIRKILTIINNEKYWNEKTDSINNDNLGLKNGIAGLGVALMQSAKKIMK